MFIGEKKNKRLVFNYIQRQKKMPENIKNIIFK